MTLGELVAIVSAMELLALLLVLAAMLYGEGPPEKLRAEPAREEEPEKAHEAA